VTLNTIIKINIYAKKNIDVMFVTVKNTQNILLKTLSGSIVVIVLDRSSTWNVLKIIKAMKHVIQFGNVRNVRKFYCGKTLIQKYINVGKRIV
jgi:hypothetical protein